MKSNHFVSTFTVIFLVGSPRRWIQAEKHQKVSNIIPGEAIISHNATLYFEGSLDPAIVHSHGVKMKWSKPRHYDDLGRKLPSPPSLAHTITTRLSSQVFTSLASKLPYEHAKQVFEWKSMNKLTDLGPVCSKPIGQGERKRSHKDALDDSVDSNTDLSTEERIIQQQQQQQDTLESCHVYFTSLHLLYGISFNFKLSFHNKPMENLSPQEIISRTTPDHRGWTQPIINTDVSVSVELCSPDFVPYNLPKDGRVRMAGNGDVSRESIEIDQRNVEEAIRALLKRSKVVLGLTHVQNLFKSKVDNFVIIPISSQGRNKQDEPPDDKSEEGKDSDQTKATTSALVVTGDKLPLEILQLCRKYELNEEECRNEMIDLESEDDNTRQNDIRANKSGYPTNDNDDMDEMNELDIMRLMDTSISVGDIFDEDRDWDMPTEDVIQLKNDMIDIERLVEETFIDWDKVIE